MKRLAAIFIALFAFLAFGQFSAAYAHDTVEITDPAAGETLEAGIIPIQLTMAEPVMTIDGNQGTEIIVTNEAGEAAIVGCLDVRDNMIGVQADLDQPGTYTVTWRTVSQDGHAVDGKFNFIIQNTSNYEATGEIACALPLDAPIGTDEPMLISAAPEPAENNTWVGLLIGMGFVLVGSVAGALSIKLRERSKARKQAEVIED